MAVEKADVWQGTLALMVLKTLEALGPLHGYGIARRIEQTSGDLLSVNYGTLYPSLLKLEQEGYIASAWEGSGGQRRLVAVNYADHQAQCRVRLPYGDLDGRAVTLQDLLSPARYDRDGRELVSGSGLFLDLGPWGYHVFEITPR